MRHWLYDTLSAEWHWYWYKFQARGSILCHGMAKLKNDPGLCRLGEIALKGYIAEKDNATIKSSDILHDIKRGKIASQQIADYADSLISTQNLIPPETNYGQKPATHPCSKQHELIKDHESDYADLLNTVQRHTKCSPKYCLKNVMEVKSQVVASIIPLNVVKKQWLTWNP